MKKKIIIFLNDVDYFFLMICEEDRKKRKLKVHDTPHFIQGLKERGKSLFKKDRATDIYSEIELYIFNQHRCIFAKDERNDSQSNYIAMFITDSGGFVAIPCFVDDNFIIMFTIKDVSKDDYPNWYISKYQEVGKIRELYPLRVSFENDKPKDLNLRLSNS